MVGFYDADDKTAAAVAEKYSVQRFETPELLMAACDAIDIVTPTVTHFELAAAALKTGKHVFIEKPVTHTVQEGEELLRLARESGMKVQVGHVERFNPAFLALKDITADPMFIEAHRLAMFQPRGTDVSVVLDLMIHDLALVLHLVKSPEKTVSASGVAVLSKTPDIANVRIEFENGCVANLTASRISLKQMRKMRLFQPDAYISLDFLKKEAQMVRMYDTPPAEMADEVMEMETPTGKRWIHLGMAEATPSNAILAELDAFAEAINSDTTPVVSLGDGLNALTVAHQILAKIGHVSIHQHT